MPMQPISENLQAAIAQLRPILPTSLGPDYVSFTAQLDAALAGGSEDQVYDLFRPYPALYVKLLLHLNVKEMREVILHGDVISPILHGDVILESQEGKDLTEISASVKRGTLFYCPEGKQLVELSQEDIDNRGGNYSCPTHHQPLDKIQSDNIEEKIKDGRESLYYCATGRHLILVSSRDYTLTPRGDFLCPNHNKPTKLIGG